MVGPARRPIVVEHRRGRPPRHGGPAHSSRRRSRMSVDLVRIVDSIHREKNIPKEVLFEGLQSALATAARKHYPDATDITVTIDPDTGRIATVKDGESVEPPDFGRIAAQTAKQVIIQK